jgi:hypothetical protein
MLVCCMIFFFADNAHLDDDDDDVFDFWLRVWLNFVKKRIRDESDDDHNERWFLRDRMIDANIQKSISRVIDVSNRVRLVRHDFINPSMMLAIYQTVDIQSKAHNYRVNYDLIEWWRSYQDMYD